MLNVVASFRDAALQTDWNPLKQKLLFLLEFEGIFRGWAMSDGFSEVNEWAVERQFQVWR